MAPQILDNHKKRRLQEALESLLVAKSENHAAGDSNALLEELLSGTVFREENATIRSSSSTTPTSKISSDAATKDLLEECFHVMDLRLKQAQEQSEYSEIETFILKEESLGTQRRKQARQVEASEEKRLATDVALLKGYRTQRLNDTAAQELEQKLQDVERSYTSRKMVLAKAAQTANGEFRLQHSRVRQFFEGVHHQRLEALDHQKDRRLKFQAVANRLLGSDARIASLEEQITRRLFEKKKCQLNELHMTRMMEENVYLEKMLDLLDKIQAAKGEAARDVFELHVQNLRARQTCDYNRQEERDLFAASATIETANIVAIYAEEDGLEQDHETRLREKVNAMERRKQLTNGQSVNDENHNNNNRRHSTNQLYDNVLWSAASNSLGLFSGSTTTGSSVGSLEFGTDYNNAFDFIDMNGAPSTSCNMQQQASVNKHKNTGSCDNDHRMMDDADTMDQQNRLTPVGKIKAKQVARKLRTRELAMVQKHEEEKRMEQLEHRQAVKALVKQHQTKVEKMLEDYFSKQQNLRDDICQRINELATHQEKEAERLHRVDIEHMRQAVAAEDRRVADAETAFAQAHELISAQVFHEVRNALSSVVAMREMTNSQRVESTLTPAEVVLFLDDMMNQTQDVIDYALKTLNNVLDVSKMRSGAFQAQKQSFDLQDVVARVTRMQQAKTGGGHVKMSFTRSANPIIAISDPDIIERIIASLISNAVKFTPHGAIQPFICPLEQLDPEGAATVDANTDKPMTMMAVGVADTGVGLCEEAFHAAESHMLNSHSKQRSHGAQNSGFGLHHAHLQAQAIGSSLKLTSLDHCREFLNDGILKHMPADHDGFEEPKVAGSLKRKYLSGGAFDSSPCSGTVIYLAVPVLRNCDQTLNPGNGPPLKICETLTDATIHPPALFSPKPALDSPDGCFRILVADDVKMLRKGLVHMIGTIWRKNYPHCPVSVSTACTAEDMIRAARSQPFDIIFCDHLFGYDPSQISKMTTEETSANGRPSVVFNSDESTMGVGEGDLLRQKASHFFKNERFTAQDGDGSLKGLEALEILAKGEADVPFPTPVLVLLSGHHFKVDSWSGIIVAQKPMAQSEFVPILNAHAAQLVQSQRCTWQANKNQISGVGDLRTGRRVFNSHGSQMFVYDSAPGC